MKKILNFKLILTLILLSFLVFIYCFQFFNNGNYASYPWWHQNGGQDADGTYVAQTISLLNDTRLHYIHHPGATIYSIHGLIYRLLAFKSNSYNRLFQLREMPTLNAAMDLIETGTRVSRISTLILSIFFMILIFLIILEFSKNVFLSFLFSFFAAVSGSLLQHSYKIRPEMLSLFFALISATLERNLFKLAIFNAC